MFSLPPTESAQSRYVRFAAQMQITRTACQLERHRLSKGTFPASLDELIPEYLPELPRDPIDHAPLRYRPTESGYDLWSIGQNRQDDGGQSDKDRGTGEEVDWVFRR